jgi:hypothetical protein
MLVRQPGAGQPLPSVLGAATKPPLLLLPPRSISKAVPPGCEAGGGGLCVVDRGEGLLGCWLLGTGGLGVGSRGRGGRGVLVRPARLGSQLQVFRREDD